MTHERFNELVLTEIDKIKSTLIDKGKEYCYSDDRLDCFKKAAALEGVSVTKAIEGMMVKHTVSIYDYLAANKDYTEAQYLEKITDNISYLLILWAALHEDGNMICSDNNGGLKQAKFNPDCEAPIRKILLEDRV